MAPAHFDGLKVFPLPSVVLFPKTAVPLHIFEPRYRDMVADALATDSVMAMGQVNVSSSQGPLGQRGPNLAEMACVGKIVWHEKLPDGRFDILVEGIARARLVAETEALTLYRQFNAETVADEEVGASELELARQKLGALLAHAPDSRLPPGLWELDGGSLTDILGGLWVDDLEIRRTLLAETSVSRRLQLLVDYTTHRVMQSAKVPKSHELN